MSDASENFVSRLEALTPAARSRVIDLILAEAESEPNSDPPIDVDPCEAAVKAGISPPQIERLNRAIDEANAYRAAQIERLKRAIDEANAYRAAQND